MKISKLKLKKIEIISVFSEQLDIYCRSVYRGTNPFDTPPDTWGDDENALWELATSIEDKMRDAIMKELQL